MPTEFQLARDRLAKQQAEHQTQIQSSFDSAKSALDKQAQESKDIITLKRQESDKGLQMEVRRRALSMGLTSPGTFGVAKGNIAKVDEAEAQLNADIAKAYSDLGLQRDTALTSLASEVADSYANIDTQEASWQDANVEVNGGWVSKDYYNTLTADDQALVVQLGTGAFNTLIDERNKKAQADQELWYQTHVYVPEQNGWVDKSAWEAHLAELATLHKLPNGEYIELAKYNELSNDDKALLDSLGIDKFNETKKASAEVTTTIEPTTTETMVWYNPNNGITWVRINNEWQLYDPNDPAGSVLTKAEAEDYRKQAQIAEPVLNLGQQPTEEQPPVTITAEGYVVAGAEAGVYTEPEGGYYIVKTNKGDEWVGKPTWDAMSEPKKLELIMGRAPTAEEYIAYKQEEAGAKLPWYAGSPFIWAPIAAIQESKLFSGEQSIEKSVDIRLQAAAEWEAAYPELKKYGYIGAILEQGMGLPATKALYPQIASRDITKGEWAMTGISGALWAAPVIGKGISVVGSRMVSIPSPILRVANPFKGMGESLGLKWPVKVTSAQPIVYSPTGRIITRIPMSAAIQAPHGFITVSSIAKTVTAIKSPVFAQMGRGLQRAGLSRQVEWLAFDAGKAYSKLKAVVSASKGITVESLEWARVKPLLREAQITAYKADAAFLRSLGSVKLTASQIARLEKVTGFEGLGKAIKTVGGKSKVLEDARANLGKYVEGSTGYIKAQGALKVAEKDLEASLSGFDKIMKPRYTKGMLETNWTDWKVEVERQWGGYYPEGARPVTKPSGMTPTQQKMAAYKPLSPQAMRDTLEAQARADKAYYEQSGVKPLQWGAQPQMAKTGVATAVAEREVVQAESLFKLPKYMTATEDRLILRSVWEIPEAEKFQMVIPKFKMATFPMFPQIAPMAVPRVEQTTTYGVTEVQSPIQTQIQKQTQLTTQRQVRQAVIGQIATAYQIKPAQISGVEPLTAKQINIMSQTSGLTAQQINTAMLTGSLVNTLQQMSTIPGVQQYLKTGTFTDTTTGAVVETQPRTQEQLETKGLTQTQVQTKVQTEIKTQLKTPIPIIPISGGKWNGAAAPEGSAVWRQGEVGENNDIWWIVPSPYDKKYYQVGEPPEGVTKVAEGKGSAYESIQVIGGVIYDNIKVDLGWADILITPDKNGKAQIKFTRDPNLVYQGKSRTLSTLSDVEQRAKPRRIKVMGSGRKEIELNEEIPSEYDRYYLGRKLLSPDLSGALR